jgi:peptidoglycan DL-endopeptidase CwlO
MAPASVALRGFDSAMSSTQYSQYYRGLHHHSEGYSDDRGSDGEYPIGGYSAGGYADSPYRGYPMDGGAVRDAALEVRIPGHGAVDAPNPQAARAVRTALGQIGTPYVWGGTTPGVGLDCSGLTQYAYREAGIDLPRLAQDQCVGARVAPGDLQPGDLAVWSGHVAMIVGNGQMVEAQQPGLDAAIDPIRTDNAGDAFLGFFRPTAGEEEA